MKLFYDISFDKINESHLLGQWKVEHRFINKNNHADIFVKCNTLHFLSHGVFKALYNKVDVGNWTILRETDLIYNPQLIFTNENKFISKAIITRLITDHVILKLSLYFSTGLELSLHKEIQASIKLNTI